ncbi:MAG: hypothetical protein KDK08_28435 [Rhizobiaceae bacterium]|nr:hypothetical protein [Rhizobiaceae bacterium]
MSENRNDRFIYKPGDVELLPGYPKQFYTPEYKAKLRALIDTLPCSEEEKASCREMLEAEVYNMLFSVIGDCGAGLPPF